MADRTEWKSVLLLALLKAGFKLTDKQKKIDSRVFRLKLWSGFPLFHWKKIQVFSRTFQDPHKNFFRTFTEPTNTWISRKMRKK